MKQLSENSEKVKPRVRVRRRAEPSLRKDAQDKFDLLCSLIRELSEAHPYTVNGQIWAPRLSQQEWADRIGVNPRTLRRYIKRTPILTRGSGWGAENVTLLRIAERSDGDPFLDNSNKKIANTISKLWREHVGRDHTTPNEYGKIWGMVEDWPDGWQVRIFKHTLARWSEFKLAADLEMEIANACLGEDNFTPDAMVDPLLATARKFPGEEFYIRYYAYPNLGFMRKFNNVAFEIFVADRMERGMAIPPSQQLSELS